ncbi:MAG: Multidrug resistance protein stp [Syntrophorhabdus sp. PtaB.Bin047]|jgi:EmrB/QacA subfamily drug resistance transporter|nr:MAG: Multidrug resistance protein stp [Syntrophorhabdus sp. PtaB.Bin047]
MDARASLKRNTLLAAVMSSFLGPFTASSVTVALPRIGEHFSMDAISLGWVATAYLLSAAAFLVPVGRASDIYGRKKVFLWGMVFINLSSLLAAFSTSGTELILWRIVQGVGSSMIFGTGVTIVASVYPASERGKALGIVLTAVYVGVSSGPFIGGVLTDLLGWRSLFFTNVAIGMVVVVTILWKIREEWVEAKGESFDVAGSILYVVAFTAAMYGLTALPSPKGISFFSGGLLGLFLFGVWELKVEHPVLDMRLFMNSRVFLFSNLAALINYSATFAVTFLISLYLQYIKRLSPQAAGLVLVSQPLMQAVLSTFTGRLSDRVEPRVVSSMGMVSLMVALVFFGFLDEATHTGLVVLNLLFLGFGFALFVSPNTNAIMSSVDKKFYGVASGTMATMRVIGQTVSMGIVMFVFMLFMGRNQITRQYYGQFLQSTKTIFFIFAFLSFLGIFASLARGRIHKGNG